MSVPVTPVIPKDFNPDWAGFVLKDWFIKNERDVDKIKISKVEALLNGQQVTRTTLYIVFPFLPDLQYFSFISIFSDNPITRAEYTLPQGKF